MVGANTVSQAQTRPGPLPGPGSRCCLADPFSIAHHHRRHPHGGGGLRRILGLPWCGRRWCRPGSEREEGVAVPPAGLRSRRAAWAAGRAETTGPSPSGRATADHLNPRPGRGLGGRLLQSPGPLRGGSSLRNWHSGGRVLRAAPVGLAPGPVLSPSGLHGDRSPPARHPPTGQRERGAGQIVVASRDTGGEGAGVVSQRLPGLPRRGHRGCRERLSTGQPLPATAGPSPVAGLGGRAVRAPVSPGRLLRPAPHAASHSFALLVVSRLGLGWLTGSGFLACGGACAVRMVSDSCC